jgi:hypothetical protein
VVESGSGLCPLAGLRFSGIKPFSPTLGEFFPNRQGRIATFPVLWSHD